MKHLATLLCCLCIFSLSAQIVNPDKVRFGKISDAEMELSSYDLQPDADAVVLFDEGKLRMDLDASGNSFEYILERHLRIKILKPAGTRYADFSFWLEKSQNSSDKEEIIGTKGATYNLVNGKIEESKLSKDGIFTENISEGLSRYSITFPQVKEGSVIELKFTLKSDYLFNLPTWYFQQEIPTDYSLFEAEIPEYYMYSLDMQGFASSTLTENVVAERGAGSVMLKVDTRGGRPSTDFTRSSAGNSSQTHKIDFTTRIYHWVAQKVPGLTGEIYAPSPKNFFFRVSFELSSVNFPGQVGTSYTRTWEDVSETYQRGADARPYLTPKNDIQELAQSWVADASDETAKVLNIYEGIKANFNWNENFRITVQNNPNQLIKLKIGNSAEINYMLLGALRSVGISADPVLLSTREHGYLSLSRPSITQFNHLIVLVKLASGESFLLDATSKKVPGGLLPEYDLVQKGRLMTGETSDWVNIIPPASEKTAVQMQLNLSKSGELSGESTIKMSDYAAMSLRSELGNEAAVSAHLQEWLGLSVSDVQATGFNNLYEKIIIQTNVDANNYLIQQDDFYYVQAVLAKQFADNPLKAEERILPIDLVTPLEQVYVMQLTLEEGLSVEELPEGNTFSLEGGKARYSIRYISMNGGVQVVEKLTIKEPFYGAEEYAALKNFMDLVIENQQATLVVKRG